MSGIDRSEPGLPFALMGSHLRRERGWLPWSFLERSAAMSPVDLRIPDPAVGETDTIRTVGPDMSQLRSLERPRWSDAWRDGLALIVVLVPILACLSGVLFRPDQVLYGHDVNQNYNWEKAVRFALEHGRLPLWDPFVLSGFPVLADFQTGALYPPSMLLRVLPLNQFLVWNVALHLWIAGAGAYLLCRQLGTSRLAATMGAIAFSLAGVLTSRLAGGHLHFLYATAWLPLVVALALRSASDSRLLPHPALVVVLALQYLPGYVQFFVYSLAAVGLSYLCTAFTDGPVRVMPGRLIRSGVQLAVLVGLVVALAAIQLLPAFRLLPEMGRTSGIDYESATRWSLELRDLVTVIFPRAFADVTKSFHEDTGALLWEKVSYVGVALPLLAPLGLYAGRRRPELLFFGVLALAALLLAFGRYLPFYQAHYALFSGFRYPGRLLPLWSLAVVVLGAVGVDTLMGWAAGPANRRRAWAYGFGIAGVAGIAIAAEVLKPHSTMFETGRVLGTELVILVGSACVIIGVAVLGRLSTWHRVMFTAMVVMVAADLTTFARPFVVGVPQPRHEEIAAALQADEVGRVLTACEEGFSPYRMTNALVPMVDGLNTAFLRDYARFSVLARGDRMPSSFRQHPTIWLETPRRFDLVDVLNVTHVVNCTPLNMDRLRLIDRVGGLYLYRNVSGLARARWTCQVDVVDSDDGAIRLLSDRQRDARARTVLLREPGTNPSLDLTDCQSGADVQVLVRDTPTGDLAVQVDAPSPGILVMSEVHYPERRVWVDGAEAPFMKANLAFMAVALGPGTHRVELRFAPTTLFVGAAVSTLTLIFLLGLWLRRIALDGHR